MICSIIIIMIIVIDDLLKPAFTVEANRYQPKQLETSSWFIIIYLLLDIGSY